MIKNPKSAQSHDRLAAFLETFPLTAVPCDEIGQANLLIVGSATVRQPTQILFRPRVVPDLPEAKMMLAGTKVDFGGSINPLVGALPEEITLPLEEEPHLAALAVLVIDETERPRCGGAAIRERLAEVVVVLAVRRAIAAGTVNAGLLMGLAHPELHASLVAMHDAPARQWRLEELATIAGMGRSRFIREFAATVGTTPVSYLNGWRLTLGRVRLRAGKSVKATAASVGFGSAAAFSRAYSRHFGHAPSERRQAKGVS
ncbi:AraC family transcriptional regulator [Ciceribacter thiooxidans]|uniref:AraC family transcriptional regulator n=1 Tax=Ciceribacter thiooxidans TaxID=1969821 RepID=A0ABV7I7E9_9HYPH|nr:AraC family transcriptional regulator [Ciceribacter thiooxidans]